MSKIIETLAAAAKVAVPNLTDNDALKKLIGVVGKLADADWNKLTDAEQDYVNEAVDAINARKPVPMPPDYTEPAPAEEGRRRTRARDAEPAAPAQPTFAKGDKVKVTNKRGVTYDAVVIDTDDKGEFVVDNGKDEIGYAVADVTSGVIKVVHDAPAPPPAEEGRRRTRDAEPAEPAPPAVGDTVEIVNSRDRVSMGNVIELKDGLIVIKTATGEELDFEVDRLKSVVVKVRAADAGKPPAGATRGRSRAAEPAASDGDGKTRSVNPGVSVGQRIREIVIDNEGITEEKVGAMLDKEGLKYAPASLSMNYRDTGKFLELLKSRKMLR